MSGAIFPGLRLPGVEPAPASDVADILPPLPSYATEEPDAVLAGRRPGFGEALGANVREGWWNTTIGTAGAMARLERATEADPTPLPRHEWEASQYWRPNVPFDERMTVGRARALAEVYDENAYRRQVMQARDGGVLESVLGFGAQLVGSIPDPVNFLPIAGPVARGARAVGATRTAAVLERGGVAGAATRGAVEGFGGNLAAAPFIYSAQATFGDDVSFARVATDLSIGALIGAGFGTAGGLLARLGAEPSPQVAARTLDLAARDVAAGRAPEFNGPLIVREIEDTIFRAAPESARPMVREVEVGGEVRPQLDLPTRADGAPLSREELDEWLVSQGRLIPLREQNSFRTTVDVNGRRVLDVSSGPQLKTGAPVQVRAYHGTRAAFDQFAPPSLANSNTGAETAGRAIFFSTDPRYASEYAAGTAPGGNVRPSAVTLNNPLVLEKQTHGISDIIEDDNVILKFLISAQSARHDGVIFRGTEGGDLIAAFDPSSIRSVFERGRMLDEAFDWYQAAMEAQRSISRLSAAERADVEERPAIMEFDGGVGRQEATRTAAREDPELARALDQIEALRAEGRLTEADLAVLRAADEDAAEIEAVARGFEQAGACLLRNLA